MIGRLSRWERSNRRCLDFHASLRTSAELDGSIMDLGTHSLDLNPFSWTDKSDSRDRFRIFGDHPEAANPSVVLDLSVRMQWLF
mmetsp:Transcript_33714/g.77795  ORF Transcript_33714/g.77795 Transcript_33714/m.77795 type:complete len:84 (-) Transcript_33714:341-592(-)